MKETKFTKGSWTLNYGMVAIGDINYELDNTYDAPLIACAPDMYEMLEALKEDYPRSHPVSMEIEQLLKRARGE